MSDSQVLARKFRPQTFAEVVGQEVITRTLTNALNSGRLHHAYLLTGARGVGKTTTARILAKCLNCIKGITTEPCGECASCVEIAGARSIDVMEIDAASNTGVDNVREVIINSITICPARDRHKIFIIDEVHMLSTPAFNALLKTIEEPPPRVLFILATTDVHKVPETIISRCQLFEFRTIALGKILDQLRVIAVAEGVNISDRALLAIARAGEGSMRDAESALDQVISFAGTEVADEDVSAALGLVDVETLNQTVEAIAEQDSHRIVKIVDEVVSRGNDLRNFCREMMAHFRGLLMIKIAGFDSELTQMAQLDGETLAGLADSFSEQDLLRFFSLLTKTEQDIRLSSQPRFQLEIGLLKLAQASRLYLMEDALRRLEELQPGRGGATATTRNQPARETPKPSPASGAPSKPSSFGAARAPSTSWAQRKPAPARASAPPPEPPDDVYAGDFEPEPPSATKASAATATAPANDDPVRRIKAELEAKNKMMIVSALDKGEVTIDGDYLRVSYAATDGVFKTQLEARDKRTAIEEACQKVMGRRLSLLVVTGSTPLSDGVTRKGATDKPRPQADSDPKLRALVDRFHGEVIEVIKPDGRE